MLKIHQNERYIGPTLCLFVKVIKRQDAAEEISSFAPESNVRDVQLNGTVEKQMELIRQGVDVYSDGQLFNMASILCDEGYGSFDRCMLVLRTLRGDIVRARKILSQLTFTEA